MIVQEINLYQDRFKEKRIWLSVFHLLFLMGLTAVILLFSSYWYDNQYKIAEQQHSASLQTKEQADRSLKTQQKKLQLILSNNHIDIEISKVSTDIAARKRIISFVESHQFGSGKGFSSNLDGLTEIKISDIWLNEISLAKDFMQLSGSALKAETIPEYFNLFRQKRLFNGNEFEIFELNRVQEQGWKVDFLIASRVSSDE
ncbi:MAG: hypothetical protein HOM14_05445 [Gammaproteobacteria bacterium]|jgi:Tfp pilus assembly protein PilN|nr:hypothetical protein [Gammaproteobacteria bacterium]MBT3723903.1 hypothetical protein [Gammaproteobacteria bacterium]MBT4078148.1 hypothetical protein [Gammaproteobacteria bacterium]MBT4194254.1 hypothetical protein [Gammaproteobacteria bacterium]MBT4451624.1 hypothetical protein [Gammaproteobacteria bacterium]